MRVFAALLLLPFLLQSQTLEERLKPLGTFIRLQLRTAPFPHPARDTGHVYGTQRFPAALHYRDSAVGVFLPLGFRPDKPLDLVVHIHGWWANIDSVIVKFMLAEQLAQSGKNAVLVVPQGPKNAPDSFGGRLEEQDAFRSFVTDVGEALYTRQLVGSPTVRTMVLSGHSGAYRMMSFILLRGGVTDRISEVYTFDALYGQLEKFGHWLTNSKGRFVATYCDSGGTKSTTESLMEDLKGWQLPFAHWEETDQAMDLKKDRITFIHSDLGHNEVIAVRNQFQRYLSSGSLDNRQ
jgi:hypothetical protein